MGVVCLARWNDANSSQSLLQLQDRVVKQFHGVVTGRWYGNLKLFRDSTIISNARVQAHQLKQAQNFRPNASQQLLINEITKHTNQTLYQLTLSNLPKKVFSWSSDSITESDPNLELLLSKLTNIWVPRQSAQIEGFIFDLGDFILRAGDLNIGTSYKGILLEVEYQPCNHPKLRLPLAKEFLAEVLPRPTNYLDTVAPNTAPEISFIDVDWYKTGLSTRTYSSLHTSHQYRALFEHDKLL
ncbi:hypothetical protein DSO57_1004281 [Entomophthora muscae]|uniref:Uncharacterized protein n=1 Tax=Entomophthora muscae TaxID=34485 RepID=A0ACC2RZG5_9FUNG|nr:hypothetical protein DSO57_1004281 [Entomophthora muscae]